MGCSNHIMAKAGNKKHAWIDYPKVSITILDMKDATYQMTAI